jgi:hypothetical protein
MKVKNDQFTMMKGHVLDGCIIISPSGKEFVLVNTIHGWMINGPDGQPCSGYLPSAYDVEFFIVNGLQTH